MTTIFTQIINGEIPATKIYEDEITFAFLDANPVNPGHTLVIPKEEYKDIYEIPEDVLCNVAQTTKLLAPVIKKAVNADGLNIHNNNEAPAGQKVFHFHLHLIPRFKGDGYTHWHGAENYHEGNKADEIAKNIKKHL